MCFLPGSFDVSFIVGRVEEPNQANEVVVEMRFPHFCPVKKQVIIFPVKKTSKICKAFGGPMVFCMCMCTLEVLELRNSAFFFCKGFGLDVSPLFYGVNFIIQKEAHRVGW